MYQFYYADRTIKMKRPCYQKKVEDCYHISAIRPAMWEEHCLECAAPHCFQTCPHYEARRDGRCKRFINGIRTYPCPQGIGGQAARIHFRKWADLMTALFPTMLPVEEIEKLTARNQRLGNKLRKLDESSLPLSLRWNGIRAVEYLRRRYLKQLKGASDVPDAFIFHGYSFEEKGFCLIMEIFQGSQSVFKYSFYLEPGENLIIVDKEKLTEACSIKNNLVKIYPENNIEAELDILWCDFVQGEPVDGKKPSDKIKCLAWDLDNTLWDGILIETEDPSSLRLRQGVLDTIKELDRRGVLQSIASKNDYELAWPVVEQLGLAEYFLYPQIHWKAKSSSLEQLAQDLNIGIDTVALIDDSVFERNQVKSMCDSVRVYDVTEMTDLLAYPEFDLPITELSGQRRMMYRAEAKRMSILKEGRDDTLAFLKKCNLQAEVFAPEKENEIQRCYELIARTNQLNLSGVKYTEEEFLRVLQRDGHTNLAVSCRDDFGSYGVVGFLQYKRSENRIIFTEYAMSCRVAGKYIESALFTYLLKKEDCESGVFKVNITKKNGLLRRTLEEIGFHVDQETKGSIEYTFDDRLKEAAIVTVTERIEGNEQQ